MAVREFLKETKGRDKKTSVDVNEKLHEDCLTTLKAEGFSFADLVESAMMDYLATKEPDDEKKKQN